MTAQTMPDLATDVDTDRLRQAHVGLHWPTLGVLTICAALWLGALLLPAGWGLVQWVLIVFALTLHSSLSHEILHGLFCKSDRVDTAVGLFQPGLFVPYLRFRALHLAHHKDADLTDPYDDPESHYLDPAVWQGLARWQQVALRFNNTLFGRLTIGPFIGMHAFMRADLHCILRGDRVVLLHWLAHLPGVAVTLWIVSMTAMPIWAYVVACYATMSVLRIRTFLEHRAHERPSGRTVVIEDRGVLALLFLNNNLHAVHHMHPQVPWYHLPALYRAHKERFLCCNQNYVFGSYKEIFAKFMFRAKDPVAHPIWQPKDE